MRTPSILTVLALVLAAPMATSQERPREDDPWYLQIGLGTNFADTGDDPDVDWDTGFFGAVGIGYDMGHIGHSGRLGWALETEVLYNYFKADKDDIASNRSVSQYGFLANAILDYRMTRNLGIYAGGGAGYMPRIVYDPLDTGSFDQKDKDGFAYQAKAGFIFYLGGLSEFLIGGRYFGTEDLDVRNTVNNSTSHIENRMWILEFTFRWGI